MVIEKILKQLTPARIKKELKAIQRIQLPPRLQKWVREYEKIGERNSFFWKWLYKAVQLITSPTTSKKYRKSLWEIKVLTIMFITLLDDVADKTDKRDLLNELLKIPLNRTNIKLNRFNIEKKQYLISTRRLLKYIIKIIKKYPRYEEFREIFDYDILQACNSIRYSNLVNKIPSLINKTEYSEYLPYNMQGFVSYDLDLMCSLKFKTQEIRILREIIWRLQKMARISNWITTWEREIGQNDFTSGVFAYAIDIGKVNVDGLQTKNTLDIIKQIKNSNVEKILLKEWEKYYYEVEKFSKKIKVINIRKILSGLEKFLILHLTSRGYI